ncbi:SDR family oxidoreductase [Mycobacterium sp. RTGN5]|uniref:SDR family oxidoreductase n=1 Tax=Mycobacterium sp. RTGN5 TaxID=3016522 RepID=UPI0029C7344E|nr:SDR family oxidoreductase [Mycobacterium sp. RTGN5]
MGAPTGLGGFLAAGLGAEPLGFGAALPQGLHGAVLVVGSDPAPAPEPLSAMTGAAWNESAPNVIWQSVIALQRSRAALLPDGGRIVVVTPTVGLTGASTLVAYTTACEGVRALAKSAARQWAREAISVNLLAVPLELVAPGLAGLDSHLTPAAIGERPALLDTVLRSAEFLLGSAADTLTGITIIADGGAVMAP